MNLCVNFILNHEGKVFINFVEEYEEFIAHAKINMENNGRNGVALLPKHLAIKDSIGSYFNVHQVITNDGQIRYQYAPGYACYSIKEVIEKL